MRRWLVGAAVLALAAGAALAWRNAGALERMDRPITADSLTAADRRALAEARRLKAAYGEGVWPGLGRAALPQVVYNDRWSFLVGWPGPAPEGWQATGGEPLFEAPVLRRRAGEPTPLAARIGNRWAGRWPVRRLLDRRRIREARRGMDPVSAALIPPDLSAVPRDLYAVQLLHAAFHAHQGALAEDRLYRAVEARDASADRYPFDDPGVSELWRREGAALGRILAAEGPEEACRAVEAFRSARGERRDRPLLDATLVDYERDQEWLQGLAKYAEMTFHRRAAAGSGTPEGWSYPEPPAHWTDDLRRLRSSLGEAGPDRRFALSGLGIALALERLRPDWKPRTLPGDAAPGELLAEACDPDAPGSEGPAPRDTQP